MVKVSDFFFLTTKKQKEKLDTVVETIKIAINPFDRDKVVANVKDETLRSSLEFSANNPFTTAGLAAASAATATRAAVGAAISGLSTTTKVVASAVGITAVPLLASSEKARVAVIQGAGTVTPEKLARFGAESGGIIQNPSAKGVSDYAKDNASLLAGVAGLAVLTGGARAAGIGATALNVISTERNTNALKEPPIVNVNVPAAAPVASAAEAVVSSGIPTGDPKEKAAQIDAGSPDTGADPGKGRILPTRVKSRKAYKRKVTSKCCGNGKRGREWTFHVCSN